MSSASESELAALFYGCKASIPLRTTLEEMGHAQPGPTPVTTDNNTAHGLTMKTMVPKAAKQMDMRFNWLKCRRAQRLFQFLWEKAPEIEPITLPSITLAVTTKLSAIVMLSTPLNKSGDPTGDVLQNM